VLSSLSEYNDHCIWLSYLDHPTTLAKRATQDGREQIGAPLL